VNSIFLANIFGLLSVIAIIATIYPSLLNIFQKNIKHQRLILKFSHIGILFTTSLGLIHGLLMTQSAEIDFYNLNTYWIYTGGVFLFNLVVFLAFTFPQIKSDIKKLSYFNYAVLLLLVCHVGQKIIF